MKGGNERTAHAASPRDWRCACGLGPVPRVPGGELEMIVFNSLLILHPFSRAAILNPVVRSFLENSLSELAISLLPW